MEITDNEHGVVGNRSSTMNNKKTKRKRRIKKQNTIPISNNDNAYCMDKNYRSVCFLRVASLIIALFCLHRPSKYLKMPQELLLRALRRQLDQPLKTVHEKVFILSRLQLLDRYVFVEISLHLWQTCFETGCKEQIWPVSSKHHF